MKPYEPSLQRIIQFAIKGEQGGKDEATKTVQVVSRSRLTGRRGAEDTPPTRRCRRRLGREAGYRRAPRKRPASGNESARLPTPLSFYFELDR